MPFDFQLSSKVLPSGRTAHYAAMTGSSEPPFLIGYVTKYGDNFGIYNTVLTNNTIYQHTDFEQTYGFWSRFIFPTAMAESKGSFCCLNTYDRARFTFTFMQFAAHVPNGDFVRYFRRLLALPDAPSYFPKLVLTQGRISYKNQDGSVRSLEDDSTTDGLMNYLNPTLNTVEPQELISAARFVHWANHSTDHRNLQVAEAVDNYRQGMKEYDRRFNLDQVPAHVCQMICDIRHQGRALNDRIAHALDTNKDFNRAFDNLCEIGEANYASRIATVKSSIQSLQVAQAFSFKYDRSKADFVPLP
jgi:hypothetical protein